MRFEKRKEKQDGAYRQREREREEGKIPNLERKKEILSNKEKIEETATPIKTKPTEKRKATKRRGKIRGVLDYSSFPSSGSSASSIT